MSSRSELVVGFVGLGDQGAPIATMIERAGFPLHLWARRAGSLERFEGTRAVAVDSMEELGRRSQLLGVCVFDDDDVDEVVSRALPHMRPDSIIAIHSTVHPDTCRAIGARAADLGVHVLDAPVSGSGRGALAGTLAVMAGGDAKVFERARPVFESFGIPRHVGPLGSGQLVKILNNATYAAHVNVGANVVRYAAAFGLDPDKVLDVMGLSSGRSHALDRIDVGLRPGFKSYAMPKDAALFVRVARDADVGPTAFEQLVVDATDVLAEVSAELHGEAPREPERRAGTRSPVRPES